jgi:hypothetical protein
MDWCCSWLYSPREDGMPRTLITNDAIEEPDCTYFIDRIKKVIFNLKNENEYDFFPGLC